MGALDQAENMNAVRPFDYEAFIEELRELLRGAQDFDPKDKNSQSEVFRVWRTCLRDALERVRRLGYKINCPIEMRLFGEHTSYWSSQDGINVDFSRDLTDTLTEISLLITNFKKYGDPTEHVKPRKLITVVDAPPPPAPLSLPDKISVKWMLEHVPVHWYWYAGVSAFSLVAVGMALQHAVDELRSAPRPIISDHPASNANQPLQKPAASAPPPVSKSSAK
jgi:hypothetical protein